MNLDRLLADLKSKGLPARILAGRARRVKSRSNWLEFMINVCKKHWRGNREHADRESGRIRVLGASKSRIIDTEPVSSPVPGEHCLAALSKPGSLQMNPGVYRTCIETQQPSVKWFADKVRTNVPTLALSASALLFVTGFAVASLGGFAHTYGKTPSIYCGCLAFASLILGRQFLATRMHKAFADLRPCLLISDDRYRKEFHPILNERHSNLYTRLMASLLTIGGVVFLWISFFSPHSLKAVGVKSARLIFLAGDWYPSPNAPSQANGLRFGVIAVFVLALSIAVANALVLVITNFRLLFILRNLPVAPLPNIIRVRLRSIAQLHLTGAVGWFIGVFLIELSLRAQLGLKTRAFFVILSCAGLAFLLPAHVMLRKVIFHSYRAVCDSIYKTALPKLNVELTEPETDDGDHPNFEQLPWPNDFNALLRATERPRMWVYDRDDIVLIAFYLQFALFGFVYQSLIHHIFSLFPALN